jgi:copper chaperone NosL
MTKRLNNGAKSVAIALALLWVSAAAAYPAEGIPKPGAKDKCPVCGMFVAKYPDWISALRFADGRIFYFDGVKDLMKFTFALDRYAPGRARSDITAIQVTDYYAIEPVDGKSAFYVTGSDVFGPMGKELIPFASRAQAEEFLKDHKGKNLYLFDEITPDLVQNLD